MRKVIAFPPKLECPACGMRLRQATRSEINSDLIDSRYRHVAQWPHKEQKTGNPQQNSANGKKKFLRRVLGCFVAMVAVTERSGQEKNRNEKLRHELALIA